MSEMASPAMRIAFTICSNNYLAQAKTLADSLLGHNPQYRFFICLCDKRSAHIDYSFFEPHTIVEVERIRIDGFENMVLNYDLVELNTALKPFCFTYFFERYRDAGHIMYFDPDIQVYHGLESVEEELRNASMLLTPHITRSIPNDGRIPSENNFLTYGLYNLGFLAARRTETTFDILRWWSDKLKTDCYYNLREGLFVDQLPMNFLPIFYDNVKVSKNPGLNVAYWNLQERRVASVDEQSEEYLINETYPLVFFHFSNFNPSDTSVIARYQDRFEMSFDLHVRGLFLNYAGKVLANRYQEFKELKCVYVEQRNAHRQMLLDERRRNEGVFKKIQRGIRILLEHMFKIRISRKG